MPSFNTPSTRWTALTTRDPLSSSAFIYSVLTTRIYCRPTCPSRLARRANIIFHDTAAEAAAAGFRPCRRCRPDVAHEKEGDGQLRRVKRAKELIEEEEIKGKRWSVRALAKEVGSTESHFCRVFRKVVGMTIGEYRASLALMVTSPREQSLNEGTREFDDEVGKGMILENLWLPGFEDSAYWTTMPAGHKGTLFCNTEMNFENISWINGDSVSDIFDDPQYTEDNDCFQYLNHNVLNS